MKRHYLSVFLLIHLLSIVAGATNRKQPHEMQAFDIGNTSFDNFITSKKKTRLQLFRKYKHGIEATKHEQNEILRLTPPITKKEHIRKEHSLIKRLVNYSERKLKLRDKENVLKINELNHEESEKRAINFHTAAVIHRQVSNGRELDHMKKLYNVELRSLKTAAKEKLHNDGVTDSSYGEESIADFPLISYQETSNDSNPVRIEYVTDKEENVKQDNVESVKERDNFEKDITQAQNVTRVGDGGTSLEDFNRASNDSRNIRNIVNAFLKDKTLYQNSGEYSSTSSNESKIKESASRSDATRPPLDSLSGDANSNETTKVPFANLSRELMKAILLLQHSKHSTNYSQDKTDEIHFIHTGHAGHKQEEKKNKSGDTLYPSVATPTHALEYETADHKGSKHLSSHQVLLEYFRKEHDLRHNGKYQTVASLKSQHEQGISDGNSQATLSHGLPRKLTFQNKQNLNLTKSTADFDFNSTVVNFANNAFTSATKDEVSSSLNKTTKISTDLAAVRGSFLPMLEIELRNNTHFIENSNFSDGKPVTLFGDTDNGIQGKDGTNVTFVDLSATLINMGNNSNNNKSLKVALTNNMQQANVSTTEFDMITRQEVGNLSNPLNTSNMLQESQQHKTNFELPVFNSSLLFPLHSKIQQDVLVDMEPVQEENAETRNTRKPIQAASLSYTHKKRLQTLQQLETNISVNFLETWIYHYKSLDGLGLTPFMLKSGFSYYGSTKRLQRVIEKALLGKDVNLLIVGGSISAGGGIWKDRGNIDGIYDRALIDWWKRIIFPLTNSKLLVNEVTIGGTDSEYFSYCVKNYIKTMPDIVLWEMAANDYKRYANRSFDPATPLERLTRLLLSLPSHPALVFVNFFRGDYYKTTVGQDCPDSEDEGEQNISKYYNITSLSWRSMICSDIGTRRGSVPLTLATLFSNDGYHPSLLGHAQMASLLITYMKNVMQDVISKEINSMFSDSVSSKTDPDKKPSDIPEPLYTDQTSSDPRCWTLLTPNYSSPIDNTLDSLVFTKAEHFEFTNITHWPVRLDSLRCLRAQQSGAVVKLQFFVPSRPEKVPEFDDISSGGREIAITTHNSFGGSAEVWLDRNYGERLVVVEPKPGQRRTQVNTVKKHAKTGMHTLTIKAMEKGFCLSAVMVQ